MSSKMKPIFSPYHYVTRRQYIQKDRSNELMRQRLDVCQSLFRKDLYAHYGCVNAIEFSNNGGEWLVSGGDDKRVLLWNLQKALPGIGTPTIMKGEHSSNIFCLAFDNSSSKVFSAGNDEQVIIHDTNTGETVDVFLHEEAVYGLSVDPLNDNVFASACDDGRILIWDMREPATSDPFCLANYTSPFHAVMFNPIEPRLLATANSKEGVGLWDVRSPRSCVMRYGGSLSQQSCMSVRFNCSGTQILTLRRRLPPVLYGIHSQQPQHQFDHTGYYNSCTMKSCCFAGDKDQYVMSGSDDFNIYMWKIPESGADVPWVSEAHLVLKGHRSIVNQVRFDPKHFLVVSSGVEKVVKLWSPFPLSGKSGGITKNDESMFDERPVYSHEEYINLVLRSGQVMSHDYSHQSTKEDPRMMAFFDSLVQREIEGWTSDSSLSSTNTDSYLLSTFVEPSGSDSDSISSAGASDEERGLSPFTIAYASAMNRTLSSQTDALSHTLLNLDDVAPLNSEVNRSSDLNRPSSSTMQRPPSISQLIAQKRREQQSRTVKDTRTEAQRVKCKKNKNFRPNSDHSDSSESPSKKARVSNSIPSATATTADDSDSEETDSRRPLPALLQIPPLKNDKRRLLRKRRARLLQDISDSDSDDNRTQTYNNNLSTIQLFPVNGLVLNVTNGVVTNGTVTNGTVTNGTVKSATVTNGTVIHSGTNEPEPNLESDCLKPIEKGEHSATGHFSEMQDNEGISSPKPDDAGFIKINGSEDKTNNNNNNNNHQAGSSHNTTDTNGEVSGSNGNSTWLEFKRFKNRVERARRHYRRQSAADDNSSD